MHHQRTAHRNIDLMTYVSIQHAISGVGSKTKM